MTGVLDVLHSSSNDETLLRWLGMTLLGGAGLILLAIILDRRD